ncbi:MAG TPA: Ig-like domain-containing protein [Desulfosporosinus sp.]|nr:Ig-like domain-containing protein [Desulfosporosinus sp.]
MISKPGKPSTYIATFRCRVSQSNINVQPSDNSNNIPSSRDQSKPRVGGSGSTAPPADTLTIKVGYYGEPYVIKKVFTLSDFNALPQVHQAYTFIDAMPAVVIDSVIKGVKLSDVLASAGIDINSVQIFNFWTNDINQKAYQTLTKSFLYAPRSYYPNLPTHWDEENALALPGAADGAVPVEPVLAAIDNWRRFATAPDFDDPDNSTRFRLMFGQVDTVTQTASRSAKWINAIEVQLGGTSPKGVSLDKSTVNLKVGSTFTLTANIEAADPTTDKRVTWSSSDPTVAKVDENGQVTIVGQGTANITVTTVAGNKTAICIVNSPNQATGSTNTPKNGSEATALAKKADSTATPKNGTAVSSIAAPAGSQPWRVYEMSAEAVPMQQQKQSSRVNTYSAVIALLLFLCGSGKKYAEYIREVTR